MTTYTLTIEFDCEGGFNLAEIATNEACAALENSGLVEVGPVDLSES